MKKSFVGLMGVALTGLLLASCGDKYTPLTEEQKAAKVDSLYAAQSAPLKAEKLTACEADMQAKVDAKVAELVTAAAAASAEATAAK